MALGRDIVYRYLRDLGIEYLFGVPGTNEIPLIDGSTIPDNDVAYVQCLHENIAMGAAMGYARTSGKPGVVELHLTPGAAHGVGNLYNAYRSHVPVVVLCVQQHSQLLLQESLLWSELTQVANQYTKWSHEVRFPDELPVVLQRAFKEAMAPPSRPVFVSIPYDFTLAEVQDGPAHVTRVAPHFLGDRDEIRRGAERLAAAKHPIVVAGDGVGAAGAWEEIDRLAMLLGAPVFMECVSSYMNYPNHLYRWKGELPGDQVGSQKVFEHCDVAFLCGFNSQAAVLVYEYALGPMIPAHVTKVYLHDDEWEIGKNDYGEVAILGDIKTTLPALCDEVAAHPRHDSDAATGRDDELRRAGEERSARSDAGREAAAALDAGAPITGTNVAIALAALQEEMRAPLILVNEAISDTGAFEQYVHYDAPDSYFCAQGASLGYSMPASLGVKLAAGEARTVVNVVGDGSALFYPHTWWTARKFELPILFVVVNNREYKTLMLGLELMEKVYSPWEPSGDPWYLRLTDPPTSFVRLAAAFGVDGTLVSEIGELDGALRRGLREVAAGRPFVVEVLTDPSLESSVGQSADASKESGDGELHERLRYLGAP